jgi:hypothetical protein
MKKLSLIIVTVFVFGVATITKAQDSESANHNVAFTVPNFAILDIETTGNNADITLSLSETDLEAGSEFDFSSATNSDLWLNYTALTDKTGANVNTRKVSVQLDDAIPGINLKLAVAEDVSAGDGQTGGSLATSAITLTTSSKDIINEIGSCYTGNGASKGHNLTYSLEADNYSEIEAGSQSVTVTYTITAQ